MNARLTRAMRESAIECGNAGPGTRDPGLDKNASLPLRGVFSHAPESIAKSTYLRYGVVPVAGSRVPGPESRGAQA